MADGRVEIDLEINDDDVEKKLDESEKNIDKFAKDVSNKEVKVEADADTSKVKKELDNTEKDIETFAKNTDGKANVEGDATLDTTDFERNSNVVVENARNARRNSNIDGEANLDSSNFERNIDEVINDAQDAQRNSNIDGKVTVQDRASSSIQSIISKFKELKDYATSKIDIPKPGTDEFSNTLDALEGKVLTFAATVTASLAIGETIKTAAQVGIDSFNDLDTAIAKVRGALGETEAEAQNTGNVIKEVYETGVGESMSSVADAVTLVKTNLGDLDDGTLSNITQQAITLEDTFGVDMSETLRGAKGLMTNFGLSAEEAMDYIITGTQEGLNWTDELGDNISEYAGKFAQAGYSASDYFQLLQNGADSGAYNLDKVNDAINEVTTRLADGTIGDSINLFSKDTQKLFKEWKNGGASQKDVIDSIVKDITECDDQQKALTMSATAFGTMGEDANLTFAKALNDVGDTYDDVSGKSDQFLEDTTTGAQKTEGYIRQLKDSLSGVGEVLTDITNAGLGFLTGDISFDEMISQLSTIGSEIISYFASLAPDLISTGGDLIYSLVTGVINGIPQILMSIPQLITTFVSGVSTYLPMIVQSGMSWLQSLLTGILNALPNLIASIPSIISAFVSCIVSNFPTIVSTGAEILSSLISGILGMIGSLVSSLPEIGSAIIAALSKIPGEVVSIGKDIITGLWNGINDAKDWILDKISGFVDSIIGGIKDFFGIGSPSKILRDEVGKWLPPGISVGFEMAMPETTKEMSKQIDDMNTELANQANLSLGKVSAEVEYKSARELAQQTSFANYITNSVEVDYDRLGQATAKAIKDSGIGVKLDSREIGRVI